MRNDNQLSARVRPSSQEALEQLATDRDMELPDAERAAIREGLESYGYTEKPLNGADVLLYYVRRIGILLGFVGLIVIGYGIFGSRLFSYAGFGLVFVGFVMVALEGFLRDYGGGEEEVVQPA